MKTKLLLLLSVLTLTVTSQSYTDSSAHWFQTYSWYGSNATNSCLTHYYFKGDTSIQSKHYLKMFRAVTCNYTMYTYDSIGNPITVVTTNIDTSFDRFFRESNKAFYSLVNDSTELRDYNFNVHDFLSFDSITAYSTCSPSNVSILMHDTVCLGEQQRKRWQVSMSQYPSATQYIEGVGPNSGFASPICRNGCPECGYGLQYFILGADTLYHGDCMSTASIPKNTDDKIYFAQENNLLTLAHPKLEWIEIFDLNGQRLITFNCYQQGMIRINTESFAEGIYLLTCKNKDAVTTKKFSVQR